METKEETFIDFRCPHCEVLVRADKKSAGRKGKCPNCDNIITIPKKT